MAEDFANLLAEGIEKRILYAGKGDAPSYEDGTKVITKYFTHSLHSESLRCRGGRNECLWSTDHLQNCKTGEIGVAGTVALLVEHCLMF